MTATDPDLAPAAPRLVRQRLSQHDVRRDRILVVYDGSRTRLGHELFVASLATAQRMKGKSEVRTVKALPVPDGGLRPLS